MKFETIQPSNGKLTNQMIDQYKRDGFLYHGLWYPLFGSEYYNSSSMRQCTGF